MSSGNGQICGEMTGRIKAALLEGPLVLLGACLVAHCLEYDDWRKLPAVERHRISDQARGLLSYIDFVEGRPLAQAKQGPTVIYFLV